MSNRLLALTLILTSLAASAPRLAKARCADLVVTHARIHTVDESRSAQTTCLAGKAFHQKQVQ